MHLGIPESAGLTEQELVEFKRLLVIYLGGMHCAECTNDGVEDRHIITCVTCGKVIGDLKTIVEVHGGVPTYIGIR